MAKLLAMILAGGEGRRLDPLTRDRAKPAVPFGGRYRIVDFVLSNMANSGILKMKVVVQYKSESLNTHVQRAWRLTSLLNQYVELVPAQMRVGPKWFEGSADAIYQNLNIITDEEPDFTFVFGADHVYRMDARQMLAFHQDRKADLTVAAVPIPVGEASEFGIIEVDAEGRMVGFVEKPTSDPKTMPGDPTRCLASMGNYLFTTEALVQEIVRDAGDPASAHDFGKSIVASMYQRKRVYVYDFARNVVPGQTERERGYWRDVGSIDAYFQANMDLVAVDPVFSLYNDEWPIFTVQYNYPPAKFVFNNERDNRIGRATDSLISEGCIISGAHVHHSILSPKVRVNSYATVEESIVFENVNIGRHCRIRRAIIDKHVDIPAHTTIGFDHEKDRKHFHVTESGIVIIPKGMRIEAGR
ncbi:glucose-1-phosphate adenylyltransferase [Anaeromyxobacter dehalogenans]|uniref:Glucose-1-phosphate adenylyltransferase n=1 Tax=Anaeromyxobacter dehalogenans (strain 2CP-C) TaxID=290397 RepID=GLGC_ANADE|nr:glucose-1-phosphate adenylyltransferase [Anaeromyxobacter dehalogenans]Q2IM42.1 RecName: Full=Glucose-1-phosphate adenylyltransferase; AltName: Full=ADP-glucose pyrophosphorylase; Short=ADPGlc PPase; AltName: Full=ADP-glucose synthase [Anaeromyxobacter dehalogenans 2CP-C]ABC79877.1 Glucose-1-phosphate adenylyltransferase [Anaeromyxobacter dehalogenans 2CP-C]